MTRHRPEQQLQRALIQHLRWRGAPGAFAFHPANGGWRSATEAKILKSVGVVAGVSDIVIIYGGRCYALELKAANGRLTDVQRVTHERLRAAGAEVATAHGIDEALEVLEGWQLLRRDTSNQIANAFSELRRDVARRAAEPNKYERGQRR
jgi:hypothetical protein